MQRRYWTSFVAAALVLSASVSSSMGSATAAERAASVGATMDDFSLQDFRGKSHSLSAYSDAQAIVVAFLGTECPLARLYGPRLQELANEYADKKVVFLGIDSNRQDSITEIDHYARTYGVEFPLLKDTGNVVADQFGAERTPEIFVLDADHVVRYRGRVDDQYGIGAGTGYAKVEVRRRHLPAALDEILAGKDVTEPLTDAPGCLIGRVRDPNLESPVTYSNQIARILQNNCVECHRAGQIAPFELREYDEVAGWAEMIEEVVREQRMPPWHADPHFGDFINDRSMSSEEKELIYEWVKNGAPEGDPAELPEPIEYNEGWVGPTPSEVIYMDDEPYKVAAEGIVEYQYFMVDPGWTEDRWMKTSECLMGNRSVVHHIFVFAVFPGADIPNFEGASEGVGEASLGSGHVQLIGGAAPGTPPWVYPRDDMATFLPAGTRIMFQMHYTPVGTEVEDISAIGFTFADPAKIKHDVSMNMAINFSFNIPPGADNHPVESSHTFRKDSMILTMAPHMHLRGKAFRYDLRYPDGTSETLLDVPQYDFNWQVIYMLREPKFVPAGTEMYCLAHFDNSEDNLANPDPTSPVRWGDQTWEEMMIGWFSETDDVNAAEVGGAKTRTARFVDAATEKAPRVGKLLTRAATRALRSEEHLETFVGRLQKIVPQIDRVCVSVVGEDQVEVLSVAQSPVLNHDMGIAGATFDAADSALASIAAGGGPVVQPDLSAAEAADLKQMAKRAGSSFHVPVTLDGKTGHGQLLEQGKGRLPRTRNRYSRRLGESCWRKEIAIE